MGKSHAITIGEQLFPSKKAALAFYKNILGAYETGVSLNDADFEALLALCKTGWSNEDGENDEDEIQDVFVDYHPAYKKTKCFQIVIDDEVYLFSYALQIQGSMSASSRFSSAWRNEIKQQLRSYKMFKFRTKPVRCAISNAIVEWEECHVDHKPPLTFSVIAKSFIVSQALDVNTTDYEVENHKLVFADRALAQRFLDYHKQMAVLSILAASINMQRSGAGRIKPSKKDTALSEHY